MSEFNLETVIKSGVEKALNEPIVDGKSIAEWAAIGMKAPHWISVKDRLPDKDVYIYAGLLSITSVIINRLNCGRTIVGIGYTMYIIGCHYRNLRRM